MLLTLSGITPQVECAFPYNCGLLSLLTEKDKTQRKIDHILINSFPGESGELGFACDPKRQACSVFPPSQFCLFFFSILSFLLCFWLSSFCFWLSSFCLWLSSFCLWLLTSFLWPSFFCYWLSSFPLCSVLLSLFLSCYLCFCLAIFVFVLPSFCLSFLEP